MSEGVETAGGAAAGASARGNRRASRLVGLEKDGVAKRPSFFRQQSLPGDGFGFASLSRYGAENSAIDEAMKDHIGEALGLAEKLVARSTGSDGEEHPTMDVERMVSRTYGLQDCYFVGHTNTVGSCLLLEPLFSSSSHSTLTAPSASYFCRNHTGHGFDRIRCWSGCSLRRDSKCRRRELD